MLTTSERCKLACPPFVERRMRSCCFDSFDPSNTLVKNVRPHDDPILPRLAGGRLAFRASVLRAPAANPATVAPRAPQWNVVDVPDAVRREVTESLQVPAAGFLPWFFTVHERWNRIAGLGRRGHGDVRHHRSDGGGSWINNGCGLGTNC